MIPPSTAASKSTSPKSDTYDSSADTRAHIKRVQDLLEECRIVLMNRAWVHDSSKLQSPEKEGLDSVVPKLKNLVYGSPEYLECLKEMQPFLEHHYRHNSHHPEHWPEGIQNMSLFDLLEMLMDWKSATERMKDGGDIYKSINFNQGRFAIQSQLTRILQNTAREMKWEERANETTKTSSSP